VHQHAAGEMPRSPQSMQSKQQHRGAACRQRGVERSEATGAGGAGFAGCWLLLQLLQQTRSLWFIA